MDFATSIMSVVTQASGQLFNLLLLVQQLESGLSVYGPLWTQWEWLILAAGWTGLILPTLAYPLDFSFPISVWSFSGNLDSSFQLKKKQKNFFFINSQLIPTLPLLLSSAQLRSKGPLG